MSISHKEWMEMDAVVLEAFRKRLRACSRDLVGVIVNPESIPDLPVPDVVIERLDDSERPVKVSIKNDWATVVPIVWEKNNDQS